jgi:hypothetical protein
MGSTKATAPVRKTTLENKKQAPTIMAVVLRVIILLSSYKQYTKYLFKFDHPKGVKEGA